MNKFIFISVFLFGCSEQFYTEPSDGFGGEGGVENNSGGVTNAGGANSASGGFVSSGGQTGGDQNQTGGVQNTGGVVDACVETCRNHALTQSENAIEDACGILADSNCDCGGCSDVGSTCEGRFFGSTWQTKENVCGAKCFVDENVNDCSNYGDKTIYVYCPSALTGTQNPNADNCVNLGTNDNQFCCSTF